MFIWYNLDLDYSTLSFAAASCGQEADVKWTESQIERGGELQEENLRE